MITRTKKIFWKKRNWLDEPVESAGKVLDIGAGGIRRGSNVIMMDIVNLPGTDVVHNADEYPWPFEDNSFDYVVIGNVFEHITDPVRFMTELHRVLKNKGIARGITPHFSNPCAYADPTHKHYFSIKVFEYFCKLNKSLAVTELIKKILGCDISIGKSFCREQFIGKRISLWFREPLWILLLPIWGNLFQEFYEVYFSRLFPAWGIVFEIEAIK